jgi:hypothetical protein
MKDKEWCQKIEIEMVDLKNRISKLEGIPACSEPKVAIDIELIIEWPPDAEISGMSFDALKKTSVFELKNDGNYYSRDIIFNSARDTDEGTGIDLLSKYLESEPVKQSILKAFADIGIATNGEIKVFLPEENQGIKKYNGVDWWYWLKPPYSGSAASFCIVRGYGNSSAGTASSVGGCAPAFCVA